jgi:shikimate dehydrogenase
MPGGRAAGPVIRLGVLGDPLAYTLSPALHRAALDSLGLAGESGAFPTPAAELGGRLRELAGRGFRGVNLTHPLKEAVLGHLERASADARRARSVNTVSFEAGRAFGETTDGSGFLDLLASLGRAPERERVVLLGAGGAARSLALALDRAGAAVTISARDPARAADAPGARVPWGSPAETGALAAATLVVNATPLSGEAGPVALERLARGAAIIDLVYAPEVTPWVARARGMGHPAWDGLGLLVFQARRSLEWWLGRPVAVEPLARAVGWPR